MSRKNSESRPSIVPTSFKRTRACLDCGLVKTYEQFYDFGCENCEKNLNLRGDKERINNNTTPNFEGLIALMKPSESWIARRQRLERRVPGCYALSTDAEPTSVGSRGRY
ncbi:hypothetical protein CYY_004035 [Polysphondylium violaceum]|uniref:Spt4/RpoE2 zinc finger domain-containing protein n=1 Tax=Polysphondylium violaceum TaxID=133409 RepID=A0A8J4UZM0_9MYCE|nr:hypothetical protein CYY_004035 [Polysphondylium violaceum]